MRASFTLPLFPLESTVLFPGQRLVVGKPDLSSAPVVERARDFGDAVVAALRDGDSVHDVGVMALIVNPGEDGQELRGIARCRLLSIKPDEVPIATAERFPEVAVDTARVGATTRLLRACYLRLCRRFGREAHMPRDENDLSSLTWTLTPELGLAVEQQQGFLVVPDPWTRGRLLLAAMRELEKKERFLRPWAHLRANAAWN